jgi:hypothetical protein
VGRDTYHDVAGCRGNEGDFVCREKRRCDVQPAHMLILCGGTYSKWESLPVECPRMPSSRKWNSLSSLHHSLDLFKFISTQDSQYFLYTIIRLGQEWTGKPSFRSTSPCQSVETASHHCRWPTGTRYLYI